MRRDREWSPYEALNDPAAIERLVAEAEEGYEPRLSAEFVSRPPDPEIEALRRIVFRVPADVRDSAQKLADAEKRSLAELAAAALDEYLARVAVRKKSRGS